MKLKAKLLNILNSVLQPTGLKVVKARDLVDFYLHEYSSYEEYRDTQTHHNIRKINSIWADEGTLKVVSDIVRSNVPKSEFLGLCHGTRNGFEQNFMSELEGFDVTGTDISHTAKDYERSVEWDFHNVNEDWIGKFDFVYSNSLDQSWKPKDALKVWLNQVHEGGLVVIEHTEDHSPKGASEMDPFGVKPVAVPYVLADWFGHQVSLSVTTSKKSNNNKDVWLFAIRKNVTHIE